MAKRFSTAGQAQTRAPSSSGFLRNYIIGLIAFLTVVDLFATQALLPTLARAYGVNPAAMGTAVNASTIGMAISGLVVAFFSRHIDRRWGVVVALALLAVPTAWLASAPNLAAFTTLRIVQGLLMSAAFTLTLTYLAEETSGPATTAAFAAYITGNVASNLFGRLMSATIADMFGLAANFYAFALLNLSGAVLVYFALGGMHHAAVVMGPPRSQLAIWRNHFANVPLRTTFAIGFCILFAFIGTFSYVNFVLVQPPLALGMMSLGLVYFVFLPAVFTTPLAGRLVRGFGTRTTLWVGLGLAVAGLPLLLLPQLAAVLVGLTLVGVGTFLAQATATGFVGRVATVDPGAASGLYLACYFCGGLTGSALLGQLFVSFGWPACVTGIGIALLVAARLAVNVRS